MVVDKAANSATGSGRKNDGVPEEYPSLFLPLFPSRKIMGLIAEIIMNCMTLHRHFALESMPKRFN
jgi:hypothetical protein